MTTTTRKLITTAALLSMGIATAVHATEPGSIPVLDVITVTADTTMAGPESAARLPLMPLVTVTPDTGSVLASAPASLPRERTADGRLLPRLPTIEVAARVAPAADFVVAANHTPEPMEAKPARAVGFVIPRPSSVRFTMPYYSFGGRSASTSD